MDGRADGFSTRTVDDDPDGRTIRSTHRGCGDFGLRAVTLRSLHDECISVGHTRFVG